MCARRGTVVASVKVEELQMLQGKDNLKLCQFVTNIAKHYFCINCGIYTFHQRCGESSEYVINIACFDGVKIEYYKDAFYNDGRDSHPKDVK